MCLGSLRSSEKTVRGNGIGLISGVCDGIEEGIDKNITNVIPDLRCCERMERQREKGKGTQWTEGEGIFKLSEFVGMQVPWFQVFVAAQARHP